MVDLLCELLSRTLPSSDQPRVGHDAPHAAALFVDVGSSWSETEEDALRKIKRRINADDWIGFEYLPPVYHAQLLLDWLDTLAVSAKHCYSSW